MLTQLRPAFVMTVLFTLLTGLVYPLFVWGVAESVLPAANGSLVVKDGVVVGSSLIGQNFSSDKYFHGRPSATSATDPNDATKTIDAPYNAANSSASNLGPTSQKLVDRVKGDVETLRKAGVNGPIPADAVTTSASGIDPDISPQFAELQVGRVAKARSLSEDAVRKLLGQYVQGPALGLFGQPRVNVLLLNMALDKLPS
jgi:potassium-transporting ATPase KdpC subunit